MPKNRFYVTTAIDYTNDVIHIGHAYQKVVADVLARYYRQTLGEKNVFFLTGTDEHGSTSEQAAKKVGKEPKEFVDDISAKDKEQLNSLNVSYDRFIRTTDSDHIKIVEDFYRKVQENGDIYKDKYSGLYCVSCESYKTESEIIDGHCAIHPTKELEKVTEENYFFRWSKYQEFLREHIQTHPEFVQPEGRRKEILSFLDQGLKDITISRQKEKVSWGIPVPGDPDQVIYVWFDALINYISGAPEFWPADVQILGKDNLRWHALLWPAMLKSAGYELPKTIYAHGFLSLEGKKISKTLGNIIRPTELVEKFGVDPIRYYLIKFGPQKEDADLSLEKIKETYNSDLANGLGNLVSRVTKLVEDQTLDSLKKYAEETQKGQTLLDDVGSKLENFDFQSGLNLVWANISTLDRWINDEKPWELSPDERLKKLGKVVIAGEGLKGLLEIAEALKPFLPDTAEKIKKQFTGKIKPASPLFPRLG